MKTITVESVLKSARAYYVKHPTGGALHIVLDDGNIEATSVQFCEEEATYKGDKEGIVLARLLLELNEADRQKVYVRLHGISELEDMEFVD